MTLDVIGTPNAGPAGRSTSTRSARRSEDTRRDFGAALDRAVDATARRPKRRTPTPQPTVRRPQADHERPAPDERGQEPLVGDQPMTSTAPAGEGAISAPSSPAVLAVGCPTAGPATLSTPTEVTPQAQDAVAATSGTDSGIGVGVGVGKASPGIVSPGVGHPEQQADAAAQAPTVLAPAAQAPTTAPAVPTTGSSTGAATAPIAPLPATDATDATTTGADPVSTDRPDPATAVPTTPDSTTGDVADGATDDGARNPAGSGQATPVTKPSAGPDRPATVATHATATAAVVGTADPAGSTPAVATTPARADVPTGPTAPSAATTVPTVVATSAPTPTTPVAAASAPSAPLAYPTPAQQIAPHVVALGQGPDGTHRMTLHLHPDDLGPVQIRVELLGSTINVALTGDDDSARDLLRGALTDLRRELAAAGLDAGKLDVTTHQPGTGSAGSGDDTGRAPRGDRNAAAGRSDDARSATDGTAPRTFRRAGPTHPSGAIDVTV